MKNSFILVFVALFLVSCGAEPEAINFSLKTDKTEYEVGETIKVDFVADPNWDKNAWIGLIPSNISHGTEAENDDHDIAYKHLGGMASGTLEFEAMEAGDFDLRMNESDNEENAKEVAFVSFKVIEVSTDFSAFSVKTDKTKYKVGETIKVDFVADPNWDKNAWIGILPSSIPHGLESENDQHELSFQYIEGKASGTFEFTVDIAGDFDVRMHESDNAIGAKEVASFSFIVVE